MNQYGGRRPVSIAFRPLLDSAAATSDMAGVTSPAHPACLIIGIDNHVGAYLARLLDARGVALAGVGDAHIVTRLGIADKITVCAADDVGAAASEARLVFAINDGSAARADLLAAGIEAARGAARLIHVADVADLALAPVRATIARIDAAKSASAGEAANVLLAAHDSRFGSRDTLTAQIVAAAYAAANGTATGMVDIAESGARDWGWTPEYVDAVQRLANRERLTDMVVASGHTLTAADIAKVAFGFFKIDAAAHLRITGTGTTVVAIDPAALTAATKWRASTWGADLIKALCEGAGARA